MYVLKLEILNASDDINRVTRVCYYYNFGTRLFSCQCERSEYGPLSHNMYRKDATNLLKTAT